MNKIQYIMKVARLKGGERERKTEERKREGEKERASVCYTFKCIQKRKENSLESQAHTYTSTNLELQYIPLCGCSPKMEQKQQ